MFAFHCSTAVRRIKFKIFVAGIVKLELELTENCIFSYFLLVYFDRMKDVFFFYFRPQILIVSCLEYRTNL